MKNLTDWIVPLAIAGFVVFWCLMCLLISAVGGWMKLSRRFRATQKPAGPLRWMQRLLLDGAKYEGVVGIGVFPEGLYLSVLLPFRVGHPPLLIAWREFGPFKTEKVFWLTTFVTTIHVGKFDNVSLAFTDRSVVAAIETHLNETSLNEASSASQNLP